MSIRDWTVLAFLITGATLATSPVLGAEPTEEMSTLARMFATLEARDLKGYCAAMHGAPYVGYLDRVCQSAVQNRVKKPEECAQQSIAQQVELDNGQCLAMSAVEFEKTALRGAEGSKAFVKKMAAQSIDGEKLIRDEGAKLR